MKTLISTLIVAATLGAMAPVFADDIGPDKAIELVEQGTIKHFRELNRIAQGLHPDAEIVETELENYYGKYIYKLELRDASRTSWDVDIDAQSGEVVKNRQDHDD